MDVRTAATIACVLAAAATTAMAATPTAPADRAALVAVAAANPSFNVSGKWTGDPCGDAWRGVSCDNSSRVTRLDLSSNTLTGAIPPELGGLKSLTYLSLSNTLTGAIPLDLYRNALTGAIPPELGGLASLTTLDLSSNTLTGPIPPELGGLANLTTLDLYRNALTGPIPPELGGLKSLTTLVLYRNALTGPIPPELGGLASLTYLWLSNNTLTGAIPPELGGLASLTTLGLSNNNLAGAIPPELGGLASLTTLDLSSNALTGAIPPELGGLKSLTTLDLSNNALTGAIPPELGGLASLWRLDLSNNALTGAIPPELGGLASLWTLDLSNNALTGAIPPELGGLASLMALYLSYNALTGAIPPELGGLVHLTTLDLSSNNLAGAIPRELYGRPYIAINLGCYILAPEDSASFCTSRQNLGILKNLGIPKTCLRCLPPAPKMTAAILWGLWFGIAIFSIIVVLLVSSWLRLPTGVSSDDNDEITAFGICRYGWGLVTLALIVVDVITNYSTLQALVGSWSLYVVAFLIVWQHLVSGLLLYIECVRKQTWPLATGLCTHIDWAWDWRRSIVGLKGARNFAGDEEDIYKAGIGHGLLWPFGLLYVVILDILSLMSLKVGLHLKVGSEWVNLQPYWASREVTDALFQSLPQAIFQTAIVVANADPIKSKIAITRPQFVISVSSSLASVIAVLAMVVWDARMERQNVFWRLWHDLRGILPRVREEGEQLKGTSTSLTVARNGV